MLEPWINASIQIVAHLPKIYVCNKNGKKMEQIYDIREDLRNILSYVNSLRFCYLIKKFTYLNHNF